MYSARDKLIVRSSMLFAGAEVRQRSEHRWAAELFVKGNSL